MMYYIKSILFFIILRCCPQRILQHLIRNDWQLSRAAEIAATHALVLLDSAAGDDVVLMRNIKTHHLHTTERMP
jgi:hypothetical protein